MLGVVAAMSALTVSELFGPTLQGEGPTAGRPAMFLRLGRCNLDCSWCDTPYTWDWRGKNGPPQDPTALYPLTVEAAAAQVAAGGTGRVVVTGGEPLLQRSALSEFADAMITARHAVEVETNGTLRPPNDMAWCQWNVSPKLATSGVADRLRLTDALDVFAEWARRQPDTVCFKFVVTCPDDMDEIDKLAAERQLTNVWVMPEGRDAATLCGRLGWLVPAAVERGYRVTPRLHVLAYGDRRGV